MGIGFGSFQNAKRPETPNYAAAEAMDVKLMNEAQARADSLRSSNMMGGATLYNEGMGDRSPIADYIFDEEAVADTTTSGLNDSLIGEQMGLEPVAADPFAPTSGLNTAEPMILPDAMINGGLPSATVAPTAAPPMVLPEAMLSGGLPSATVAPAAAEAAAAGSTAAGGGATASLGAAAPYVAAALAADEYLLDGKGLETITDPEAYADIAGALFGKGIIWG